MFKREQQKMTCIQKLDLNIILYGERHIFLLAKFVSILVT